MMRPPYGDLGGAVSDRFQADCFGMFKSAGKMSPLVIEFYCYLTEGTDEATDGDTAVCYLFGCEHFMEVGR